MKLLICLGILGVLASPATGQTLKPLCPDRGAIQPCIVDEGYIQVEVGLIDSFDDPDSTLILNDSVVRIGLTQSTEVQFGFSPWVRKQGKVGQGDLRINVRQNLKNDQLSLAVQPMAILPTGSKNTTQGQLGVGIALPVTYDLSSDTQLYISPTVMALPSTVSSILLGVNQTIYGPFGGTVELFAQKGAGQTQASFDLTGVWTASSNVEVDVNANIGMTSDTPDLELSLGITRRF